MYIPHTADRNRVSLPLASLDCESGGGRDRDGRKIPRLLGVEARALNLFSSVGECLSEHYLSGPFCFEPLKPSSPCWWSSLLPVHGGTQMYWSMVASRSTFCFFQRKAREPSLPIIDAADDNSPQAKPMPLPQLVEVRLRPIRTEEKQQLGPFCP
jgi:hypothetical protein